MGYCTTGTQTGLRTDELRQEAGTPARSYGIQSIRTRLEIAGDGGMETKSAIVGAANLYLDFIGMFQYLLSLFGDRE